MTPSRFKCTRPNLRARIGHPGAEEAYKLIPCAGVRFEDPKLDCRWICRRYFAWRTWPEMVIWTVASARTNVRGPGGMLAFDTQRVIAEAEVPSDVRDYAYVQLVLYRLRGVVRG